MYKRVIQALERKFPLHLAESWDNVGLLVDTIAPGHSSALSTKPKVLLTVDLTSKVVDEALLNQVGLIVAYHPFIFGGIKSINVKNPQHVSLLRLIQAGVQVYCPHTAIDAAQGGVNDWLVKSLGDASSIESKSVISPSKSDPEAGCGRLVRLRNPLQLNQWLPKLKEHLGVEHLLLAASDEEASFQSVAVCAGSGAGVFGSLTDDVDLYITGELSHHEALMIKEKGKVLVCARHSATERGFLKELGEYLEAEADVEVVVSALDADPFEFV